MTDSPKRVLVFSLNYIPFIGGAEVAIKEITDRIPPNKVEFHMVTLCIDSTLPRVEKIGNVLVHRIGFAKRHPTVAELRQFPLHFNKHYFQIAAYWKARELHLRYHYDGIWAMMAHASAIPAGLFKHAFPNARYVLTLQEGDPPEHIERLMKPVWRLFKQGFTEADVIQSISTFLDAWGKRMGFKGESVVIPNGIDRARFARAVPPSELAALHTELGKKPDDVFLVTVSRLYSKNAVDDVIRALPLLPENISFLIYGTGPEENKLRSLAQELKVENRARFMGHVSQEDLPNVLHACDIFIRPSRSEGLGISFLEAMAAGLPVIATQEGGIGDFLFDTKRNPGKLTTGWAVDKDSPEQIAAAVQDIIDHPEEVRAVTTNASNLMAERYEWDLIAPAMEKLFRDTMPV